MMSLVSVSPGFWADSFVLLRNIVIFAMQNFFGAGCKSLPAVIVRDSPARDRTGEIPVPTVTVRMIEERTVRRKPAVIKE